MSIDSVATLLDVLRRVQVLAPEQADEVARELGPHFDDPLALAEYLVEIDWLTAYQVRLLFSGQWEELSIGPYQVLDRLGEGGISEVFKAWDTLRGRIVALKVLRQHLARKTDALRQFQRELQAITRLSHPNIIKTFDADQVGALHYFAMEFVEGMDLDHFVQHVGPLPVEQACDFVRQVAQGLQHAHQLGLVHRDIKPANLFLLHPPLPGGGEDDPLSGPPRRGPDPAVKIIDWGLARLMPKPVAGVPGSCGPVACVPGSCSGEAAEDHDSAEAAQEMEAEKGRLIGTADYIAPEQARDASIVDTRADIYSLGCTFYYLLTGRTPFPGPSLMQKLLQHQEAEAEPVGTLRPDLPEELAAVVQRMMAKKPEDRFQIPLLVVAALRRFCPGTGGSSLIRPASTGRPRLAPATSIAMPALQPGASAAGTPNRPPSSSFNVPRPGSHGYGPPSHDR
jgi:serine/threonine protein kinase